MKLQLFDLCIINGFSIINECKNGNFFLSIITLKKFFCIIKINYYTNCAKIFIIMGNSKVSDIKKSCKFAPFASVVWTWTGYFQIVPILNQERWRLQWFSSHKNDLHTKICNIFRYFLHLPNKTILIQNYIIKSEHTFCCDFPTALAPKRHNWDPHFFLRCLRIRLFSYPKNFIQIAWVVTK